MSAPARNRSAQAAPWLDAARRAAFARYAARGLPGRREEAWKYTDVSALGRRDSLAPAAAPAVPAPQTLVPWLLPGLPRMVFVNGRFVAALSEFGTLPPGVRLLSLAQAIAGEGALPRELFDESHEHSVFETLNNAYASDGAVLWLEPGTRLESPLHLLFIAHGEDSVSYPRNLLLAGEGARASIIEHYVGEGGFSCALSQLRLAAGAELGHCKLLQCGPQAWHIAGIHAEQAADSRLTSHSFALGARMGRNDITVCFTGPNAGCTLNGLFLLDGREHMDHHTRIDHLAPGCRSRQYYRGVLDGASRGVFDGRVVVHPGADRTDAHQSNHNLLLSRQAEADSKPQLEIHADDVQCTHGATVGQLDEEALFYLRSRGVDEQLARSLLVYGFAGDIVARLADSLLRARIEQLVLARLPQGAQLRGLP